MCGPVAETAHRASLHSQACLVGRWWVWVLGEVPEGADLTVLRVAIFSAPLPSRDYTERLSIPAPTWPPLQALCLHTLALGHLPGVGKGCPLIYSAGNAAKVSSAHVGLETQRKRQTQRDEEGKTVISLMSQNLSFTHNATGKFYIMTATVTHLNPIIC